MEILILEHRLIRLLLALGQVLNDSIKSRTVIQ